LARDASSTRIESEPQPTTEPVTAITRTIRLTVFKETDENLTMPKPIRKLENTHYRYSIYSGHGVKKEFPKKRVFAGS